VLLCNDACFSLYDALPLPDLPSLQYRAIAFCLAVQLPSQRSRQEWIQQWNVAQSTVQDISRDGFQRKVAQWAKCLALSTVKSRWWGGSFLNSANLFTCDISRHIFAPFFNKIQGCFIRSIIFNRIEQIGLYYTTANILDEFGLYRQFPSQKRPHNELSMPFYGTLII